MNLDTNTKAALKKALKELRKNLGAARAKVTRAKKEYWAAGTKAAANGAESVEGAAGMATKREAIEAAMKPLRTLFDAETKLLGMLGQSRKLPGQRKKKK